MDGTAETFEQFKQQFSALADPELKLWCGYGNLPTDDDFAAMEERLSWHFPEPYRAFVLNLGGAMLEAKESVWPRAKAFDVGPFWTFQYGWILLGIGKGIPDFLNIEVAAAEFRAQRDPSATPLLMPFFRQAASSDYLCFDPAGRIYDWHHDDPDGARPADEGFYDLMLRQTRELIRNKEKIKRGERE